MISAALIVILILQLIFILYLYAGEKIDVGEYLNVTLIRESDETAQSPSVCRLRLTIGEVELSFFYQAVKVSSFVPGEGKAVSQENAENLFVVTTRGLAFDVLNNLCLANFYVGTVQVFGGSASANQCILCLGDAEAFPAYAPFRDLCLFGNPQLAFSFTSQYLTDDTKPSNVIGQNDAVDGLSFASLDSFTLVDRQGKVNHYIIQPSSAHLVVEAKSSMVMALWQPEDIRSILDVFRKLDSFFPASYRSSPFADEKLRLAKLSTYNAMAGVLPEKLKISVSLEASDWKVFFPLSTTHHVSASHLALGFGRAQVIAGDYIETLESRQRRGLCESKKPSEPMESDGFDQRVENLVATHNPILNSFVFNVADISCNYISQSADRFISTMADIRQGPCCVIAAPWSMKGVVSLSSLFSHPDFIDIQLQLFLGDLEIIFGTQVSRKGYCLFNLSAN